MHSLKMYQVLPGDFIYAWEVEGNWISSSFFVIDVRERGETIELLALSSRQGTLSDTWWSRSDEARVHRQT